MNLNLKKIILILISVILSMLIFYRIIINEKFNLIFLIIVFILSMIIFIGGSILFLGFFEYLGRKKVIFDKLNKFDFENDNQIYRDILVNYSPVMLAYLDNMEFDYDILIVSGLLSLLNNKFIKIVDDKIEVIKFDFYNLNLPERYIIENIRNGKVMIEENDSQFYKMIFEECKRKKIFKISDNWFVVFCKKLIRLILILVIWYVVFSWNEKLINEVFMKLFFFFGWVYICSYGSHYQNNPYIRSEIGDDLNCKLEGLKNYLKEYSSLDDRKSQEIVLWEDYLIYSVIFNQNKNIILEYEKYYKNN